MGVKLYVEIGNTEGTRKVTCDQKETLWDYKMEV